MNEADAKGVTPLHIAVFDGHVDMAKVLLSARADVGGQDLVVHICLRWRWQTGTGRRRCSSRPEASGGARSVLRAAAVGQILLSKLDHSGGVLGDLRDIVAGMALTQPKLLGRSTIQLWPKKLGEAKEHGDGDSAVPLA